MEENILEDLTEEEIHNEIRWRKKRVEMDNEPEYAPEEWLPESDD